MRRLAAWLCTGPAAHLVAGVVDGAVLIVRHRRTIRDRRAAGR